jgi:hypothetical protein
VMITCLQPSSKSLLTATLASSTDCTGIPVRISAWKHQRILTCII